jgi:hypothetical protein
MYRGKRKTAMCIVYSFRVTKPSMNHLSLTLFDTVSHQIWYKNAVLTWLMFCSSFHPTISSVGQWNILKLCVFLIIKMEVCECRTVARVLKWNWKMAYECHCWVLDVVSFFVIALMKHVLIVKICECVCARACAAVSTEHSIIVIAKWWIILYWSKNQFQTVCYENFRMLCLMDPHNETIRYHTAWC